MQVTLTKKNKSKQVTFLVIVMQCTVTHEVCRKCTSKALCCFVTYIVSGLIYLIS